MPDSDPVLTISLPKSEWEALLTVEPFGKETYTDEGISIFNAFAAIHQAVNPNVKVKS